MSIVDVFTNGIVLGAAIVMAVITIGPFYLLFEVLPKQAQEARKAHFLQLRRTLRKERAKKKRVAASARHGEAKASV